MEKFEIVKAKDDFTKRINDIKEVIKLDTLKDNIKYLEAKMLLDGFWTDQKSATLVINKCNSLKEQLSSFLNLESMLEEILLVLELGDESLFDDCENSINNLEKAAISPSKLKSL